MSNPKRIEELIKATNLQDDDLLFASVLDGGTTYVSKKITLKDIADYVRNGMGTFPGSCKITLHLDGGELTDGEDSSYGNRVIQAYRGETLDYILEYLPTKRNYQFTGWFYGDNRQVKQGDTLDGDIDLYAHWEELSSVGTYRVISTGAIQLNGVSPAGSSVSYCDGGAASTLPANPTWIAMANTSDSIAVSYGTSNNATRYIFVKVENGGYDTSYWRLTATKTTTATSSWEWGSWKQMDTGTDIYNVAVALLQNLINQGAEAVLLKASHRFVIDYRFKEYTNDKTTSYGPSSWTKPTEIQAGN